MITCSAAQMSAMTLLSIVEFSECTCIMKILQVQVLV